MAILPIKRGNRRRSNMAWLLAAMSLVMFYPASNQPIYPDDVGDDGNYVEIFGDNYIFAARTIESNPWWKDTLASHGFDPDFAMAIVFPELIRYSGIRDFIETRGLEVLYVQYGQDYADFSIGLFQMKPSFAERIESDLLKCGLAGDFPQFFLSDDTGQGTKGNRAMRVSRLKEEGWQLRYLEAFIRIMEVLYPEFSRRPAAEKLEFYSTAYNSGYFREATAIREGMQKKRFFSGIDPGAARYSYSDIACFYYLLQH